MISEKQIQMLLRRNQSLPLELTTVRSNMVLKSYEHPLPASLTTVGWTLYLHGYEYPLPAGLTTVGGKHICEG